MIKTGIIVVSIILVLNILDRNRQKRNTQEIEHNRRCPYKIEPK